MKIYAPQLEKWLENAQSYQQLIDLEQKIFSEKLSEKENSLRQSERTKSILKVGFIATLIGIVVVGWLSYRLLRKKALKSINE